MKMARGINYLKHHLAKILRKEFRTYPNVPIDVERDGNSHLVDFNVKELRRKHSEGESHPRAIGINNTHGPSPLPRFGVGSGTRANIPLVVNLGSGALESFFTTYFTQGS